MCSYVHRDVLAAGMLDGILPSTSFSLTMAYFHIVRVSAAVWKRFCRCLDAIGPIHDMSSDEEFYTPPTTPLHGAEEQPMATISASASILMPQTFALHRLLSPA